MPRTTTTCPRCRQPITADIEQLFDMNTDPRAKQRLLSGQANYARCPSCGFEGPLSTPIVYHDPEKELLLTFFPSELGLPLNEQERLIGPQITAVMNRLPPEKRKAYLLRPQSMLTFETMIERILEADGITREMLQGQQLRLGLLQRLLSTSPEARPEVIKQEENLIDQDFFAILARLLEATVAQGDQRTARALAILQQELLTSTTYGQVLHKEAQEAEAIIKKLQDASKKGLTRETLLDIILSASTDNQLRTLVSLTHTGLDYEFFRLLTERIDQAGGEEQKRMMAIREQLVTMTQEINQAIDEQMKQTNQVVEELLKVENIEETLQQNIEAIDEFFIQAVRSQLEIARQAGNLERSSKLQKIINTIEKLSAPPPELALAQQLFEVETEAEINQLLEQNSSQITPEFIQLLSGLAMQSEQQGQPPEISDRFKQVYRAAMRFSMKQNLQK